MRINNLKKFPGLLIETFLSVFDHFVGLALKGLRSKHGRDFKKLVENTAQPYNF